jgi:uncharacterized protein YndB with AHSA1/START domain
MPADKADAEFVISRTFNATRQRLWEAWTKPEQIAQWLGPKEGVSTTKIADVRPGGMLHWRMDAPDGSVMWGRAVYRDVVPPGRLVYVQSFSDEHAGMSRAPFFDGRWPMEMLTTVTLQEDGTGTRVTLTWVPLNAAADEVANFIATIPSMQGGWGSSFDRLNDLVVAVG